MGKIAKVEQIEKRKIFIEIFIGQYVSLQRIGPQADSFIESQCPVVCLFFHFHIINRPGVAGAVLQTALSLCKVTNSWFVEIYSKHCQYQTGRARKLKF